MEFNFWFCINQTTTLKFIYSEKATKFCEISTVDLSYVVTVKSTVEISQNFVAFSEYMNFTFLRMLELKLQCVLNYYAQGWLSAFNIIMYISWIIKRINILIKRSAVVLISSAQSLNLKLHKTFRSTSTNECCMTRISLKH